jgi:hypothetical protein
MGATNQSGCFRAFWSKDSEEIKSDLLWSLPVKDIDSGDHTLSNFMPAGKHIVIITNIAS